MTMAHRLALGLLVAIVALAAPAAATAGAAVPAGFFGVMADGPLLAPATDLESEVGLMRGAGAGSVRVAFYWRDLQPRQNAPVDFAATDRIVAATARSGLDVLPVLVRAPAWAAGGDTREGARPDAAAYAAFATEAVRRYGPGGTFWTQRPDLPARPIRSWQVWNEPDIDRYWVADPWPRTYADLLRRAYAAIKAADPGAQVVMAGLTNRSWEDLARMYRAGARGSFDAAAIHPFSRRVTNVLKIVELARREMRRRGDARKPLLLTEVSWTSGRGRSTLNYGWETSEAGQAVKLTQALVMLTRNRQRLRIGGVWWYTWLSPRVGDDESFSYAGLRRQTRQGNVSKPALTAFRRIVRRLRAR